jgi:hypothetical protein
MLNRSKVADLFAVKFDFGRWRVRSVLRDARSLIEKGWTKYAYFHVNDDGSLAYCAVGAVQKAGKKNAITSLLAQGVLDDTVHEILGNKKTHAIGYNDQIAQGKDDVLALFDKAIERA